VERQVVGILAALVTLLVTAAGLIGVASLVTLGGDGHHVRSVRYEGSDECPGCEGLAPGALIERPDSPEVSVFTGGARVAYRSQADLTAGYGASPSVVTVSDAFYDGLPNRAAPGTLIKAAGNPAIAEVREGGRHVFPTWDALVAAHGPAPRFVVVPAYYFDGLADANP
jgi:hypothetical protein